MVEGNLAMVLDQDYGEKIAKASGGRCCGDGFDFFLFKRRTIAIANSAMAVIPPITLPIIAPNGTLDLLWGVVVASGVASSDETVELCVPADFHWIPRSTGNSLSIISAFFGAC